mmetsp:Transcript_13865/g.27167  ORF Transcript_13865/g.27167 Transcript_13865/m.27167 type:complete len:382 (-) Transcript_13865:92-1237(-)
MDDRLFLPTNRKPTHSPVLYYDDLVRRHRQRPPFLSRHRMNQHTTTLLLLIFAVPYAVDGRLFSAYEQAYGYWNIRLKKNNIFANRRWYLETADDSSTAKKTKKSGGTEENDLQILFPTIVTQHSTDEASEKSDSMNESKQYATIQQKHASNEISTNSKTSPSEYQLAKQPVNTVSCILNLEKNGKFTMNIISTESDSNSNNVPSCQDKLHQNYSVNHLPLQGEWYLTPNPYCVTDRQYDTITLVSQPRMRRITKTSQNSKTFLIERATVELHCRLWGRYGGGSIRKLLGLGHGRQMGRMTHGTVMIVREFVVDGGVGDIPGQLLPKREIVGTFRGKAYIELDSHSGKQKEDGFCNVGHDDIEDYDFDDELEFDDIDEGFE